MSDYITVYVQYKNRDGEIEKVCTTAEKKGKKIILDKEFYEFDKNPVIQTWEEIEDADVLTEMVCSELEGANYHDLCRQFPDIIRGVAPFVTKEELPSVVRAIAAAIEMEP